MKSYVLAPRRLRRAVNTGEIRYAARKSFLAKQERIPREDATPYDPRRARLAKRARDQGRIPEPEKPKRKRTRKAS